MKFVKFVEIFLAIFIFKITKNSILQILEISQSTSTEFAEYYFNDFHFSKYWI